MKRIVERIISFLLVGVLIGPNILVASSLKNILLVNTTYAGTWEDPSSGIKYSTGGGIKIKFKSTSNGFVPWVKGRSLSYNVGCNGISLEGGFLALLGLDDIESQLKDAGAAFAWGILIGLAYSLPAVSDVFAKIQKWARTIQGLLQNSCNIATNLAKNSKAASSIQTTLQGIEIDKGFGEAKKYLDSMDKKFEAVDEFITCNGDVNCNQKKGKEISIWFGEMLGGSFADAKEGGTGVTSAVISKVKTAISNEGAYYREVGLHEILSTTSTYVTLTENEILSIKLSLLFFGDMALSNKSRAFIAKHFQSMVIQMTTL